MEDSKKTIEDDEESKSSIENDFDVSSLDIKTSSISKKKLPSYSKALSSSSTRTIKMTHLYKNDKSLKSIPLMKDCKDVLVIYLQTNLITKIENLDNFVNLTHLYLQWNHIKVIENLDALKKLCKLYLSHNEINVIENLQALDSLAELHIGKQKIESGDVLVFEPSCMDAIRSTLTLLNVSGNKLMDLEPIIRLQALKILVARDNNITNLNGTAYNLSNLPILKEVYLSGNPISKMPHYKETIIAKCRNLEVIDGQTIAEQTRNFVNHLENKRASLLDVQKEKEKTKKTKSKVSVPINKRESPNAYLMQLEAKRIAAARSRELRLKQLDCSRGQIPRCFWRNVVGKRVKEYVNQPPNRDVNNSSPIWP